MWRCPPRSASGGVLARRLRPAAAASHCSCGSGATTRAVAAQWQSGQRQTGPRADTPASLSTLTRRVCGSPSVGVRRPTVVARAVRLAGVCTPTRSLFGFLKPERVTLKERRQVPFPPTVYFDVVLDVDRYHEFVPFCSSSRVTRRNGPNEIEADLTVGFRIFTEKYTSRITYERPHRIKVQSIQSSVFGHLISTWRFLPKVLPTGAHDLTQCLVEFDIDFEVSSPVHASAVKLFFTDVAERQIKAFSDRCIKLYREGSIKPEAAAQATVKATAAAAPVTPTKPTVQPARPTPPPAPVAVPIAPAAPPSQQPQPGTPAAPAAAPTYRYPTSRQRPSTLQSPLLAQSLCPVHHLGPRIKFGADEVSKLKTVFLRHARTTAEHALRRRPKATQQSTPPASEDDAQVALGARMQKDSQVVPSSTNGAQAVANADDATPAEHLYNAQGDELRLGLGGFVALCTGVCFEAGGVFSKFRERATVRTIADVGPTGVLSHALFVADPTFYAFHHSQAATAEANVTCALTQSAATPFAMPQPDPDEKIGQDASNACSTATQLHVSADLPHTFSFGEFLAHYHYLTKATLEEKILYNLAVAAKRQEVYGTSTYQLEHGFSGQGPRGECPIPDVFHSQTSSTALPLHTLRSVTSAFFCAHLGVLRHIMALMSYKRAREIRQQAESAADTEEEKRLVHASTDPGLTVLALLGLLETVLTESENAVAEATQEICRDTAREATAGATDQPDDETMVLLDHWVSKWQQQDELLALISVPGLAALIQMNSSRLPAR